MFFVDVCCSYARVYFKIWLERNANPATHVVSGKDYSDDLSEKKVAQHKPESEPPCGITMEAEVELLRKHQADLNS